MIKSSREIDAMFRGAIRAGDSTLMLLARRTPEGRGRTGRVAFIAGKKLGNAVFRNRAKRVMRASVARSGGPWPGWDVALIARRSTGRAPASALDDALGALLIEVGVKA